MIFGVVQFYHGTIMVQLITMVQMYHLKNHGTVNHGITMVIPRYYHGNTTVKVDVLAAAEYPAQPHFLV
jgi:hypothetical protein